MVNLLIATGNNHKVQEIKSIIGDLDWLNITYLESKTNSVDIVENGETYSQNAKLKIDGYFKYLSENPELKSKLKPDYITAEDSGIEVLCLKNKPGIHTARYAGENATDLENINKLLGEMEARKECIAGRSARFVCFACLFDIKREEYLYFSGEIKGEITHEIIGENGFGYDPVFFIKELNKTASELDPDGKNKISHRGVAFRKVLKVLEDREKQDVS